jgi:hypothetical protein
MNTKLWPGERVLTDAMGSLFRGWESVGGQIYITSRRLIFESHALNIQRGTTEITLENIAVARPRNTLWLIPNGMEIETRDGVRYRFVVWARARLIDMIHVCKSGAVWEHNDSPAGRTNTPSADPSIQPSSSVEGTARKKVE